MSKDELPLTTTSWLIDAPKLTDTVPFAVKRVLTWANVESFLRSKSRWSSRSGGWSASDCFLVSWPLTWAICLVKALIWVTALSSDCRVSSSTKLSWEESWPKRSATPWASRTKLLRKTLEDGSLDIVRADEKNWSKAVFKPMVCPPMTSTTRLA